MHKGSGFSYLCWVVSRNRPHSDLQCIVRCYATSEWLATTNLSCDKKPTEEGQLAGMSKKIMFALKP